MSHFVRRLVHRHETIQALPEPLSSAAVQVVDDPDVALRIVRLQGRTGWSALDPLIEVVASLPPGHQLHLDLVDADIVDAATMRRLEWTLDQLEQRAITIRIVGIDPTHPGLLLWRETLSQPHAHHGGMTHNDTPQQLTLLLSPDVPVQFRLDADTRRRGQRHIAEIRQYLDARRVQKAQNVTELPVRQPIRPPAA